jgi:hypothetical protein
MQTITAEKIVELLKDLPPGDHRFAGIETEKTEELVKKNRETGEAVEGITVTSKSTYNPMIGLTYQNTVNNRREKEGKEKDFVSGSLPYGSWHGKGGTVIQHNGQFQIRLTLCAKNGVKKTWYINGEEVPYAKVDAIVKNRRRKSTNQSQGLEDPVIIVNVKVDNIKKFKWGGEVFEVSGGTLINP